MIIFFLVSLFLGSFPVQPAALKESIKRINDTLPVDRHFTNLSDLLSKEETWEELTSLPSFNNFILKILPIITAVWNDSFKVRKEIPEIKTKEGNNLIAAKTILEGSNIAFFLSDKGQSKFLYREFVEQIAILFEFLRDASKSESEGNKEFEGEISIIYTPYELASLFVEIVKNKLNLIMGSTTGGQELITKLRSACDNKPNPEAELRKSIERINGVLPSKDRNDLLSSLLADGTTWSTLSGIPSFK